MNSFLYFRKSYIKWEIYATLKKATYSLFIGIVLIFMSLLVFRSPVGQSVLVQLLEESSTTSTTSDYKIQVDKMN